ncbi:lactonase family protein [Bifidobacterium vansinderenii]|uniref:Carboxy-cis,cis-muconate cyclase n=1 Tax=Bifidobacterium vansinderenii TaxID=1984871 RepID=A0A229VWR8_9BIFI|nr:beta-propeller fold lactonase family protein [Bifidobacterium vansinderenii]OXM99985.1 carboxy-cis,cis-muconate cyclase [Bifidobacterium vansinderenii]
MKAVDLLIGGYGALQGSNGRGIELCTLHAQTNDGTLHHERLLSDVPSPSWLERDRSSATDTVYAVLENSRGLVALRVDGDHETRSLTLISCEDVPGDGPTHVAVAVDDNGRKHAITANYVSGSISVFPINEDGTLGGVSQTLQGNPEEGHGPLPAQEGPHAHWLLPLPDGRVLSTDLGADRIYIHQWNDGVLTRTGMVRLASGTGPRDMHLLPADDGSWRVAVVDEWGCTVTVLQPDADDFRILQTVDLAAAPADQAASLAFIAESEYAERSASADTDDTDSADYAGMAYVGLRGSDRIVSLRWDGETLTRVSSVFSGGGRPRHLCAVGRYLVAANETEDHLTLFRVDENGTLATVDDLPIGSPTAVLPLV